MRFSDVIDAIVITRRHVGGILRVNKNRAKCGNPKILIPCYSQTFFWLAS